MASSGAAAHVHPAPSKPWKALKIAKMQLKFLLRKSTERLINTILEDVAEIQAESSHRMSLRAVFSKNLVRVDPDTILLGGEAALPRVNAVISLLCNSFVLSCFQVGVIRDITKTHYRKPSSSGRETTDMLLKSVMNYLVATLGHCTRVEACMAVGGAEVVLDDFVDKIINSTDWLSMTPEAVFEQQRIVGDSEVVSLEPEALFDDDGMDDDDESFTDEDEDEEEEDDDNAQRQRIDAALEADGADETDVDATDDGSDIAAADKGDIKDDASLEEVSSGEYTGESGSEVVDEDDGEGEEDSDEEGYDE